MCSDVDTVPAESSCICHWATLWLWCPRSRSAMYQTSQQTASTLRADNNAEQRSGFTAFGYCSAVSALGNQYWLSSRRCREVIIACILVALEGVHGVWSVEGEHADVVIVATCHYKPAGVGFIGRYDTDAGNKVRVAVHAMHLRETSTRTASEEVVWERDKIQRAIHSSVQLGYTTLSLNSWVNSID